MNIGVWAVAGIGGPQWVVMDTRVTFELWQGDLCDPPGGAAPGSCGGGCGDLCDL